MTRRRWYGHFPWDMALVLAFAALMALLASCGRVLAPRTCLRVVVDTLWVRGATPAAPPDSFPVAVSQCAEWER